MSPALEQLLPDDVLLEVMQYLSVDDVFACRLVCKRLEGLARHPNVWRHRRIVEKHCLCPVLRLAPCLEALEWCKQRSCESSFSALETTKCAVTSLTLALPTYSGYSNYDHRPIRTYAGLEIFTQAVRNQAAIGHLKHVAVQSRPLLDVVMEGSIGYVLLQGGDAFCNLLAQCPCLLSVRFLLCVPALTRPLESGPPAPSLVVFECPLAFNSDSFLMTMLAGHAATLEVVNISPGLIIDGDLLEHPNVSKLSEILASMPRLRSLKCSSLPRLETLAASKTLRDVGFYESGVYGLQGEIVKFLRGGKELRALSVTGHYRFDYVGMLDAVLASSGRSLEHLSLGDLQDVHQPLVEALPRLPALRQLNLLQLYDLVRLDGLLLGITPLTAPNLRRLELETSDWEPCAHHWLHGDAVRAVFSANPALHIHLWKASHCNPYAVEDRCGACASVCHLEAGWNFLGRLVLFAHEPGKCPAPEDHTADSKWRSVHMPCSSA
ncbi:uncharacterized protein LOC113215883 [Frankliniella occidentalis]|uniref:Uncharacterized protein LOC113215883 n=1 Tax=Frankliniella occidentalis TaxID=133901 RepID=A0A6J1THX3_FRAOC|nr:uncharacterized protein LOC113215883 [Frankliniella occidentalis]